MDKNRKKAISMKELSSFCAQVALMLAAGLPMSDGVATLAESAPDEHEAQMYRRLSGHLLENGSLSAALRAEGGYPDYLVEMAEVGERTGRLEAVMNRLSAYYAREAQIRSAISHAVSYPMILGTLLSVIVLIVLWQVFPVFERVLGGMGVSMSGPAGQLMRVGEIIGWVVFALIALVILSAGVCMLLMRTKHREATLGLIRRVIRPVDRVYRQLTASRLAEVMALASLGGLSPEEALEMAPMVLEDRPAAEKIRALAPSLRSGARMVDVLSETQLFAPMHRQMIRLGVDAGYEAQVLEKLAGIYAEEAETGLDRMISVIEPTLVALLSLVIGAILLALMLPMLGILRSMV